MATSFALRVPRASGTIALAASIGLFTLPERQAMLRESLDDD